MLNPTGNSGKWCKTHAWELFRQRGKEAAAFLPHICQSLVTGFPQEIGPAIHMNKVGSGGLRMPCTNAGAGNGKLSWNGWKS